MPLPSKQKIQMLNIHRKYTIHTKILQIQTSIVFGRLCYMIKQSISLVKYKNICNSLYYEFFVAYSTNKDMNMHKNVFLEVSCETLYKAVSFTC